MSHPDTTSKDAVFQWRGIPQPGQLLPLGLQHVVAAVVGVITPAILVADTCGLSSADKTLMIQVSLILTALATLLQLFPIFHRIGSGLPVIMGISFAYIPTLQAIGGEFGLPTYWARRSWEASLPSSSGCWSSGSAPCSLPWSPAR